MNNQFGHGEPRKNDNKFGYGDYKTSDWQLYESGKKYNNSLKPNYYATVDTNIAFFNGDQWRNMPTAEFQQPVFNIIKRVVTFFVAAMTASKVKIQLSPLEYNEEAPTPDMDAADIANAEIDNLLEKFKFENRVRDACFDSAVMGDVAAHLRFDMNKKPYGGAFQDVLGEICFELVDGTSIFLGNANNPRIDTDVQPYVIVQGRDMVQNLKDEAKQYRASEQDIEGIIEDKDYNYQAGDAGKIEIEADAYGKATYIVIYKYDKQTGTIKASKCTESAYMYKDIDTGLNYYPVSWFVWEKQKNQYHGRAISTGIIPNQIFINKMFGMVMYHLMQAAFPKAVYDADKIESWSNQIGEAIPIRDLQPGDNVKNLAGYLEPGNMSNQIVQVLDLAIEKTKETLGINDAMLGNVNPEQASGKSIVATVQQSSVPLENPRANLYEWVEDIGRILIDMMGTYYGVRPIVMKKDKARTIVNFDFSVFKNMWLNVKCDVGASSYWSELASVETLDNLLEKGLIDIIDYLESMPDGYINKKQELIDKLKARMEAQAQQETVEADKEAQYEQMAQFMEGLPPDVQKQLKSLPPEQMEAEILNMMQQAPM